MSVELPCHVCGYDLRAHPADGKCPECAASVAESRRVAAIPIRPAWRDSDPRWRRRMLAGVWILVLLPLMEILRALGWISRIPAPAVFDYRGTVQTLDQTLFAYPFVFQPIVFCVGLVLLFARERGRQRNKLDWTRRWGVICTYAIAVLSAASVLFIGALVSVGIAALFFSMPLKFEPPATRLIFTFGSSYLLYGGFPHDHSDLVLLAFSSIAIALACFPLFNALRSSGPRVVAALILAPLPLFSLVHLARAARFYLGFASASQTDVSYYELYFFPRLLAEGSDYLVRSGIASGMDIAFFMELAKWCIFFVIAIWLTVAQLSCRRRVDRA